MKGYQLKIDWFEGATKCYSITRPPSGGEACELPDYIAKRFANKETKDIVIGHNTRRNCPLHCIFVDDNARVVEVTYQYA